MADTSAKAKKVQDKSGQFCCATKLEGTQRIMGTFQNNIDAHLKGFPLVKPSKFGRQNK
jgi:hypothetical protein